ncbi:MAG: hypothetical protein J7L73_01965 [Anaerolineales bacterium]|nr:hypothetical protein [Anaerolineales bacterium]
MQKHNRRSIRLKGYDYSQPGAYFITIVTQNREFLFGDVINGKMVLNAAGLMIQNVWNELPKRFSNIEMDETIVMPNHFHGIIKIVGQTLAVTPHDDSEIINAAGMRPTPTGAYTEGRKTIGDIIGAFKSITTHEYIIGVKNNKWMVFCGKLWQRNYWEHIVRNEMELNRIRKYIINNPINWNSDNENPKHRRGNPCG